MSISCSVGILTFNNELTIRRALQSVCDFDDVIVCDGGSTDETLTIAREFGARIIPQPIDAKDSVGRLVHFGKARQASLDAARHQWFLFIDSDEYVSADLVEEVRKVVLQEAPAAYWTPRTYTLEDKVIHCASTYPNQQMRFFHKNVVSGFIKAVHERIELKPGVEPKYLRHGLYAPLPVPATEFTKKWKHYIAIEVERHRGIPMYGWVKVSAREIAIAGLLTLRTIRNLFICRGNNLPIRYELVSIWYQFALVGALFPWRTTGKPR